MPRPRFVIVPIVEGYGEVAAVPVLIRRWLRHRKFERQFDVHIDGPVRASGVDAITTLPDDDTGDDLGIVHYVEIAMLRRPDVVLVILDADKHCPAVLGPALLARARSAVPNDFPIGVVVANCEYEAWFLAGFACRPFHAGLDRLNEGRDQPIIPPRRSLPKGVDVESIADCKSYLAALLGLKKYELTTHQAMLTEILPFGPAMSRRSRSFRKLLKELDSLLKQARLRRR